MKGNKIFARLIWAAGLLIALNLFTIAPLLAQEPPKQESAGTEQIINLLLQKGIITQQEADALKRRPVEAGAPKAGGETAAPMRSVDDRNVDKEIERLEQKMDLQLDDVQSKTRINSREIERLEKERIDKLADENRKSSWAQRIAFDGDVRLRYENIFFDEENDPDILDPSNPTETLNTTEDRERLRARVRLGLKTTIVDPRDVNVGKVEVAVRLAAGSVTDPVSTNDTMGDYFDKDTILLDRYYLKWRYSPLEPVWGRIPQIDLTGGRMPNPWFSSDLVWDDDLNFEGLALNLKTDTLEENGWHIFLTAGLFPLQELELSSDDKWLYGGQIGFGVIPFYGLDLKVGAAYYDYRNITAEFDPAVDNGQPNYSPPQFMQYGNSVIFIDQDQTITGLMSDFDIIDLNAEADINYFFPVHIILAGGYAKNIGFDQDEIYAKYGVRIPDDTDAYRLGLKVGYPVIYNFAEWNCFYEYKHIGRDAVLDAFNDSDFHLGGTNAKGWIAGLEFGLYRNVWLRTRWITSDEVDSENSGQFAVDTIQFDINARF
jgi:hypothetical protein